MFLSTLALHERRLVPEATAQSPFDVVSVTDPPMMVVGVYPAQVPPLYHDPEEMRHVPEGTTPSAPTAYTKPEAALVEEGVAPEAVPVGVDGSAAYLGGYLIPVLI